MHGTTLIWDQVYLQGGHVHFGHLASVENAVEDAVDVDLVYLTQVHAMSAYTDDLLL